MFFLWQKELLGFIDLVFGGLSGSWLVCLVLAERVERAWLSRKLAPAGHLEAAERAFSVGDRAYIGDPCPVPQI